MTAKTSPKQEILSRLVLNFPGFEQTDSVAQLGRIRYGAEITGKIWGFDLTQGDLLHAEDSHHTTVEMSATGKDWKTDTKLVQFRWNDIVHAYEKDSFPGGFLKNTEKYLAFFTDGTVGKYRKASVRYWGFTIFPLLLAFIFAAIAWLILRSVASPLWLTLILVPSATLLLCKWPGDKLYVPLTIADWGFARDMVYQTNPEIEARFSEFGETTLNEIAASNHDEILIVGHSFGSLWAVAALSNALERQPDLFKGKSIRFLALGSSMLKIALAPDAKFMRDHWAKVMDQPEVFWHEIQTKDDLIAFYPCDPFEEIGITSPKAEFAITKVRFGKGMEKKRYKSMRKSFYRTHRQYILYYDNRVPFDYKMRLLGPFSLKTLSGEVGLDKRIDQDGKLV
ncbi:MAG: hypothetical protein WBC71_03325 [Salaquimonas sp.]